MLIHYSDLSPYNVKSRPGPFSLLCNFYSVYCCSSAEFFTMFSIEQIAPREIDTLAEAVMMTLTRSLFSATGPQLHACRNQFFSGDTQEALNEHDYHCAFIGRFIHRLLYKIIIVKTFYCFVIRIKYFFKFPNAGKSSIQ